MTNIIRLRVEGNASQVKLAWDYGSAEDPWTCVYNVDRSELKQQSEFVRTELRKLAAVTDVSSRLYVDVLRGLLSRGNALRRNLFRPSGAPEGITAGLRECIEEASRTWDDPAISVVLGDDTVHVPWGFVTVGTPRWPRERNLEGNIADFDDLWTGRFRLILKYQVNNSRLPKLRLTRHACVCAVHEDLFVGARAEINKKHKSATDLLDTLVGTSYVTSDWESLKKQWIHVNDDCDSVIYVFGHSDGEKIILKDNSDDSIYSVLPASQFGDNFWKPDGTNSASIVVLVGCRTTAPISTDPWPPNFLKATRGPGFYGFVGTEAQVPNDRACLFGAHLMGRLRAGQETLGEALDSLRREDSLFPLSLVFTSFANREFRLPPDAYRIPETLEREGVNASVAH
jgi:hypothetical protein